MARLKWRKWFRVIHRDFGYLFFGVTLIYAISGIAINHLNEWNPNYVITSEEIQTNLDRYSEKEDILDMLEKNGERRNYKNHYFPSANGLKIFLKDGVVYVNLNSGKGLIEKSKRRLLFREVNYLHYNPIKYWTWFSDLYAGALIALAITGLFLVRGKKGITGRGAWLTVLGIIIPLIYLLIYFY
ncbi:MAG: PepSY-associated TM helix domain-containing protein [Bacteroidota bacterium]